MSHALYDQDPLLSAPVFAPTRPSTGRGPLHPGASFHGVQRSGRNSYEVTVKIDDVHLDEGRLCGTLEIRGLTPELDSLVTFFEGEIVGEPGLPGFKTGKYGATEADDMKHWRRFPPFTRHRLENQLVGPDRNLRSARNKPYVFMRWKERFVVPNHRIRDIHGASYQGFYYVLLDCEPPAQPVDLSLSPHRGISPAPRFARSSSSSNSGRSPFTLRQGEMNESLLTQTRPPPPPNTVVPPAPLPAVNLPTTSPPSPSAPRPAQPRRTSSSNISYAAALRREAPSTPTSFMDLSSPGSSPSTSASSLGPTTPPPHAEDTTMTPPPTELPTPKTELDPSLSFASGLDDPSAPSSSTALSLSGNHPLHLASAFGEPSHPGLPAPPQPAPVAALSTFSGNIPISPFTSSTLEVRASTPASAEEWPVPSSPPLSSAAPPSLRALRRMSSDVASVVQRAKEQRGRPGNKRRSSILEEPEEGSDDWGLRSWTEATISGFYFHHSASPYQELSLRYVPSTQGGSAEFAFR
ncbi:hypothetical protein JCM11251_000208 [Rhodosporidiobolus azoricus]